MRSKKIALTIIILLAIFPLIIVRFIPAESSSGTQASAVFQAKIAARVMRTADLADILESHKNQLSLAALTIMDNCLKTSPSSRYLQERQALLLAHTGQKTKALEVMENIRNTSAENRALISAWSGKPAVQSATSFDTLDNFEGYYQYIAAHELNIQAAPGFLEKEKKKADNDICFFSFLTLAVSFCFLGAIVFLIKLKTISAAAREKAESISWNTPKTAGIFTGLFWMPAILGILLSPLIKGKGIGSIAVFQIALYAASIFIIAKLLPRAQEFSGEDKTEAIGLQMIGLDKIKPRYIFMGTSGFGLCVPAVMAASLITSLFTGHQPMSSNPILDIAGQSSASELIMLMVMATLITPVYEELYFRGLLFGTQRELFTPLWAGTISAAIFAMAHGDLQGTLPLFALGSIFAFLYQKTGSLWPGIISHALWNGFQASLLIMAHLG